MRMSGLAKGPALEASSAVAISHMMTNNPRSEWMRQLEEKRRELSIAYANEQFERGDEIKRVIEQMESFAASRGWREDNET
jgi:hypothetical protein